MSIIDVLKKVGLLHAGSGDYLTGEYQGNKPSSKPSSTNQKKPSKKSGSGKVFFIVSLILGTLFLLVLLTSSGFDIWFFIALALWIFFWWKTKTMMAMGTFVVAKMTVFLIILLLLTFFIVGVAAPETDSVSGDRSNTGSELAQYDGQTFALSSNDGTVSGVVGLEYFAEYSKITAYINLDITADLPVNPVCFEGSDCRGIDNYNYAATFPSASDREVVHGQLYPNFCGQTFNHSASKVSLLSDAACWYGQPGSKRTNQFFFGRQLSFKSYEDLINTLSTFSVYDAESFTYRTIKKTATSQTSTEKMDSGGAVESGTAILSVDLIMQ